MTTNDHQETTEKNITMAKRQRPRAGQKTAEETAMSRAEAEQIVNEVTAEQSSAPKRRGRKKKQSVGFSLKVPQVVYDRLVRVSEETGMSMASIMVRGAAKEMDDLENK